MYGNFLKKVSLVSICLDVQCMCLCVPSLGVCLLFFLKLTNQLGRSLATLLLSSFTIILIALLPTTTPTPTPLTPPAPQNAILVPMPPLPPLNIDPSLQKTPPTSSPSKAPNTPTLTLLPDTHPDPNSKDHCQKQHHQQCEHHCHHHPPNNQHHCHHHHHHHHHDYHYCYC